MKRIYVMLILLSGVALTANAQWAFEDVTPEVMQDADGAYALAWGDVDNNGYPDLFVGCHDFRGSHLYLRFSQGWIEVTDLYEIGDPQRLTSAQFIDYDRDNLLDLLCLTMIPENPVLLYKQLPNHRMQLVPIDVDFNPSYAATCAAWHDMDNDGSLELLLNGGGDNQPEVMVLERSGQSFVEVRGGGLPESLNAGVLSLSDYDRDGDADLLVSSENDNRTRMFEWISGDYHEITADLNIQQMLVDKGVTWADFDRDGNQDFFAFGAQEFTGLHYGIRDHNDRKFTNRIDEFGLEELAGNAVDASAVDANNDGWTDLMVVREDGNYTYILINEQGTGWSGGWTIPPHILPPTNNYACAWADFDLDGDMDYALSLGNGGVRLYENQPEVQHEWIEIRFCGSTLTPLLNCAVEVEFEHCKQWASTCMSQAGVGSSSSQIHAVSTSELKSEVVYLHVTWPNGMNITYPVPEAQISSVITLYQPSETDLALSAPLSSPIELGNHPNPFNPTTTIQFTVPVSGMTKLSVYNLLGQEVALLANETMEAGTHSLVWDASMLPSGLYFAHLEAAGQIKMQRMLLTK